MSDFLDHVFDDPERPEEREGRRVTVRVFETESKFRHEIHRETELQLAELEFCGRADCTYEYTSAVGFIVHHYLHLIRESSDRVQKAALKELHDILNPARTISGEATQGVLTDEERKQVQEDPTMQKLLEAVAVETEDEAGY